MTDTKLFLKILAEQKVTCTALAKAIGLSRQSLSLKIHNKREFVTSEIEKICKYLNIGNLETRQRLFFAEVVA